MNNTLSSKKRRKLYLKKVKNINLTSQTLGIIDRLYNGVTYPPIVVKDGFIEDSQNLYEYYATDGFIDDLRAIPLLSNASVKLKDASNLDNDFWKQLALFAIDKATSISYEYLELLERYKRTYAFGKLALSLDVTPEELILLTLVGYTEERRVAVNQFYDLVCGKEIPLNRILKQLLDFNPDILKGQIGRNTAIRLMHELMEKGLVKQRRIPVRKKSWGRPRANEGLKPGGESKPKQRNGGPKPRQFYLPKNSPILRFMRPHEATYTLLSLEQEAGRKISELDPKEIASELLSLFPC